MTHQLNSNNNEHLKFMNELLQEVKMRLSSCYSHCMLMTEDQYPEVYSLRGIFMNLQAIISEVDKGIQGGYVSNGYFLEKSESLIRDLEGLADTHYNNVSTHFSTKVRQLSEADLASAIESQQRDLEQDKADMDELRKELE